MKIALVGDVALNLLEPYFIEAGFETYAPAGFAAWRQEILDKDSPLHAFNPDLIFDVTSHDEVLSSEVENFFDERMMSLAKMPYSINGIKAVVDEAKFAVCAEEKKILAVDADNTLWHGILSEDGLSSLVPCNEFQNGLKTFSENGVTLVLLTKNDPSEKFMRDDMILRDENFALRKINWNPKAGNLIEACNDLNLSADSAVFVDDNPFERAQMKSHLPRVTIAPWEGWQDIGNSKKEERQLIRRLKEYFFSSFGNTAEDKLRSSDYASPSRKLANEFSSAEDYLKSLRLRVIASFATENDIPRLAQMAGKTNQFNATTIRRDAEDFKALLKNRNIKIFVFRTSDKFSEQGIVCYVIVDLSVGRITDFVMSCRIMGRTLEYFAFRHVAKELTFQPAIDFVPTKKNGPFKAFLDSDKGNPTFFE